MEERLGIAGSGEIACGLATLAAARGEVLVWARSARSADRLGDAVRAAGGEHAAIQVETDPAVLAGASFVVEAIVEDHDVKVEVLLDIHRRIAPEALLATTTSSLSIEALARASGRPDRFLGLHVFNPVAKMALVELAFPPAAAPDTRRRALRLCEALDKTAVEVPPELRGFVVNRLLFPFLFDAVRLLEASGLDPEQVDTCMKLGAGHPMGPLALLDLVGLDVAQAIGDAIDVEVPDRVRTMAREGELGRKSGRGFYRYV
ncbi:MAG: 3-hydroxyacyl-CoA dehydrogenase family protein [Solirubrobacteraceae bacterium]